MKKTLILTACVAWLAGCAPTGSPDSLDNTVSFDTQQKVYRELRAAMKQAGAEALAAYPKTGMPEGGAEEFRDMQDSLRLTYWAASATATTWRRTTATPFGPKVSRPSGLRLSIKNIGRSN